MRAYFVRKKERARRLGNTQSYRGLNQWLGLQCFSLLMGSASSRCAVNLIQVADWIVDDVTGGLAAIAGRLSLSSQIIPARSAATAATPTAGSASESKKTIRAILATKIQKPIPTERIPRCDR